MNTEVTIDPDIHLAAEDEDKVKADFHQDVARTVANRSPNGPRDDDATHELVAWVALKVHRVRSCVLSWVF